MDSNSFALNLSLFLSKPSNGSSMRLKCAKLLKKLLTEDPNLSTWHNLPLSSQSTIKTTLLHSFMHDEQSIDITYKLRRIIVKLAPSLITVNNNSWPELLPCLYQSVSSSTSHYFTKCQSFAIFRDLVGEIGETMFSSLKDSFHAILRHTLFDDTLNVNVRVMAMYASLQCITCVSSSNEEEQFQYLLAGMMKLLPDAVSSPQEDLIYPKERPLTNLIKLAKHDPSFLRMQLVDVVSTVLDIVDAECLEEKVRQQGVEFLLTLVEAKEKAPGMVKKLPLFIGKCFAMLLKLLVLHIKDDTAWHSAENLIDESGITSTFWAGCNGLKRFCCALGSKSVAHEAKEQLSAYLVSPEWEKRHAALYALSFIARGCSENLDTVMSMVLKCFQDIHPRVRWAACLAIYTFFEEFGHQLQEEYHSQAYLALSVVLDDFHPQVQGNAITALSMICHSKKPNALTPHLDEIVNKLLVLIQNEKKMVQKAALQPLALVAESVKEHFQTYYDIVMPHLKGVLKNADLKSDLFLRATAINCICSIGKYVSKEKFRVDTKQIIEVFVPLQELQERADDIYTWQILSAYVKIQVCMGQELLPYMSAIIRFLIQCAEWHNENHGVDSMCNHALCNSIRKKVMFRDKTLRASHLFYERGKLAHACYMLGWCAEILKENFYPWIPQAVSVIAPLLKFHSDILVRNYVVKAMPHMLRCAKLAVEKGIAQGGSESYFTNLSNNIIKALVEALHKEEVGDLCVIMLDQLNVCLQICQALLHEGWACIIVDEITHIITDSSSRKQELIERRKCEDFDDEEADLLKDERGLEEKFFIEVTRILQTLIKALKAAFFPFLDELSSYLLPMLDKEETTSYERSASIRIFNYLMKGFPEATIKYYGVCLPLILDASNDEIPHVRQGALYGLRLWADNGRSSFKYFVGEAIPRINKVIMHSKAREPKNESAYDNAVSALGVICEFHGEGIDLAEVIPFWLNCLPIKADLFKAQDVHEQLCSMVERFKKELFGPNNEYIPKVISIFAKVLCSKNDLVTEYTANRMINALRKLHQMIPTPILLSELPYLLPQHEMELKSIPSLDEDDN